MHQIFAGPCLCPHHGAHHGLLIGASGALTRAFGSLTGAFGSAVPQHPANDCGAHRHVFALPGRG
jgi:hypothetical protein